MAVEQQRQQAESQVVRTIELLLNKSRGVTLGCVLYVPVIVVAELLSAVVAATTLDCACSLFCLFVR